MAGTWLKIRHDLEDAPEIRRIARAVGLEADAVLGKLLRIWSWFDRHASDGRLTQAELEDVDEKAGAAGFAAAMAAVGWLEAEPDGLALPNWERHNGETAKERALKAERMRRARDCGAASATGSEDPVAPGAPPEKRREEERRGEEKLPPPPPPPREAIAAAEAEDAYRRILEAWEPVAKAGHAKPWKSPRKPPGLADRLADPDWLAVAVAAIEHLPRCRFFRTPARLDQLCQEGFADAVLAGKYDDLATPRAGPGSADAPRTPPERRRYFRGEFQRSMTDAEYRAALEAAGKKLERSA